MRAEPGASASGPVSSGTTDARPRSIPPYGLPDRSVRPAIVPSMSISDAAARTAEAFWSAVIATMTDCDALPPPASGMDGPYGQAAAPDSRTMDGPPAPPSVRPGPADPSPTSDMPDALSDVAATYSSNAITTVPSSRSTTGEAARAGGDSSASASISSASRPAKALPDTSRTAPAATERCTSGGMPVRPPPTSAASCAGATRTRRSVPSSSDARSAPASGTVALGPDPGGRPDSSSPARSTPAASTYSSNGTVSRPCAMSRDGRVRALISGGVSSSAISSGAFDRPANRRPAVSEIADEGRSSRTGPASAWALATAPFWPAVRNMRSESSSTVRYTTSGPDGAANAASDSGIRLAPLASSMAAPDRSIPEAGTYSVNIIDTMPAPMSRAGTVPGSSAGGAESSTVDRLPAGRSPPNALPDRSAIPLPADTAIRSGPADAFAARSESDCARESASSIVVPLPPPPSASDGDSEMLPFPSVMVTAPGARPAAATPTNSSNSSVRDPVPRLRTGVPASAGGASSGFTKRAASPTRPEGLSDRSSTAPAAATSRMDAASAAATLSRLAFWGGASETTTVSLTASAPAAPASRTSSPPAAATANAPGSIPPGGPATYSSYATTRRPAARSSAARPASSDGGAASGATAMRAPATSTDGSNSCANPAGRYSCAAGPAAIAPAFCAAVSPTTTVLPSPVLLTSAPSSGTATAGAAPRISAPVRFVAARFSGESNSISSTPVPRSSRTGDGTPASSGGGPNRTLAPSGSCMARVPGGTSISAPCPFAGTAAEPTTAPGGRPAALRMPSAGPPPGCEVSVPANRLPDTSRTADPDTLRYSESPPKAARIAAKPWAGVIVTTSVPPYRVPSGEETAAPASGPVTSLRPLCTERPPVSTAVRLTYSSKDIVIVLVRRSISASPTRAGIRPSSTTSSVAFDMPAKYLPCSGAKTLWAMSMASAPPLARSAASRAFCCGASATVTLAGYGPAPLALAPASPTRSRPSGDEIAMPERSDGTATPLSKRISSVPSLMSRTGFGPPSPPPASTG